MIDKFLRRIKGFFIKRKNYKAVCKICERPIYLYKVGKYIPCGKCKSCISIHKFVETQAYLEKYKRISPWVIKY